MCQKCSHPTPLPSFSAERFSGLWFPLMSSDSADLINNCVKSVEVRSDKKLRVQTHIKRKLLDDSTFTPGDSPVSFSGCFGFSDMVILDTDYDKYAVVLEQLCCCCGGIQASSVTIYGRDPKVADDKVLLMSLFEVIERETKLHRTLLKPAYHEAILS